MRTAKAPRWGAFLLLWVATTAGAAQVQRVLDGDSLLLTDGRQVRLIGINAPELGRVCHTDSRPNRPATPDCAPSADQPLARAAKARLAAFAEGKRVRLEPGREERDRHGRTLAHVFLADGTNVGETMLHEGLAWLVAIPPNVSRVASFSAAETEARNAGRGVWAEPAYQPLAAEAADGFEGGFRMVKGTVRAVRSARHVLVIELTREVIVMIQHEDWRRYFAKDPRHAAGAQALTGKQLVVRGWAGRHEQELRLHVGHPTMLTFAD